MRSKPPILRSVSLSRGDLWWAIAIALLTGTLFLVTLRPDVGGTEDSPKFQFLGQVLGTAHTPGYPFYTIATYLFTRPRFGTLAYRVNLFSAVCGVFSCVLIFLMARRLGISRSLSTVASLAAATGFPVWSNAITAEVYTLSALMSAWTIYLLIAWAQTGVRWRLFAACAVFAAGLGNHLTIVGLLPAALIYGIAKDRSVLKPRVIAIAAIIGAIGVAQYGFIALRTMQGAPYLEARATTIRGVYDVIIARDVSWARFYQAADKVVGIEVPMLLDGLRVHMGTVTVILVVIAIGIAVWRRNYEALLVAGGAAGTLAMIANLWGDVVGFITPVVVLLWTLAAYGLETIVRAIRPRDHAVNAVAVAALALPVWNVFAIYPRLQPLLNPGEAPALREMYERLPPNSAVVAHNYFIARILNYLDFSNEYEPDPSPKLLFNDVSQVKAAAAEGRQVFALEEAARWLTSQGLLFEPTSLTQQRWATWLASLPRGFVLAEATAGTLMPSAAERPGDMGRFPNFATQMFSIGGRTEIVSDDTEASITRELSGRTLRLTASDAGAQIKWGDDVLVAIDRGFAAAAISPSGRVIARWAALPDEETEPPIPPIAFVYRGETPCAVLRTGQPMDVSHIVNEGGWYATIDGRQTPAEITIAGGGAPVDWRHQLVNGRGKAAIDLERSRLLLDGVPGTRAVFRLSLASNQPSVLATLESSDHVVRVCQIPVPQLPATGALETGPASDGYFGVGWHSAEDAGTQHFRWSRRTSSMRWRGDSPMAMRFILPLRAAHADGATLRALLNGIEVGTCTLPKATWTECRISVDSGSTRTGVNELTLTSDTIAPGREGDPRELAFEMQAGRVRVGQ
jgi:hypothetical protein